MTAIEWTQRPGTKGETWNPVVGCTPVSAGCLNCYAATMARRLEAMGKAEYLPRVDDWAEARPGEGALELEARTGNAPRILRIAELKSGRAVFTGEVRTLPGRLAEPLGWKRPRTVFVNSMSDLFHEAVPFEFIDQVFAVMALCPRHAFLVLTKRPERMAEYLADFYREGGRLEHMMEVDVEDEDYWFGQMSRALYQRLAELGVLPNVWLGTSVEHQAAADERIPHLLKCPAAVRFLSCEPMLGPVDIGLAMCTCPWPADAMATRHLMDCPADTRRPEDRRRWASLHWVIAGGESGAQARACDVAWLRSIVRQCRSARVPVFVKQLGARPMMNYYEASRWYEERGWDILDHRIFDGADGREWVPERDGQPSPTALLEIQNRRDDRKGGDPAEWPEDLRVREWPGEQHAAHSTQHTGGGA